jgi:nitrogen-specific signal transduction histidine kinase
LGLTIAQKIVQDHGGSLELESSFPGSTVILMALPCVSSRVGGIADIPHQPSASSSAADT